jgi:Mce-associated membrane protein
MPPGGGAEGPQDTADAADAADATGAEEAQTTPTPDEAVDDTPADDASADDASADEVDEVDEVVTRRRTDWARVVAYGVLPGIALVLAMVAGYLKWQDNSVHDADKIREETIKTAKDSTIKMLSYKPDTVAQDLNGAKSLLTGDFRDQYTSLTTDVVIPGAQQKKITAVASVPAAAAVSADPKTAVVLLFVNQTVTVGADAPTDTASSVRVTLEKVGDHWLISKFDPV